MLPGGKGEHTPGAGPKDAENLMARKVNKLFAMLAAGEPAFVNNCWLSWIKMPDCVNCWLYQIIDQTAKRLDNEYYQ